MHKSDSTPKPSPNPIPNQVPPEALHKSDDFRRAQLYTVPVHNVEP